MKHISMFQLAPVMNAMIVWWNIPRVAAAYFYLKNGERGPLPQELFDYMVEMDKEQEQGEKESLTPGVGVIWPMLYQYCVPKKLNFFL